MYAEIVPFMICPDCRGPLDLDAGEVEENGEVLTGRLHCGRCSAGYPVRDGIADMLGPPRPLTMAQVVNGWPLTAWAYERVWRPFALTLLSGERFPYRRELPLVTHLVEPQRRGLYIDVACSNGLYARALARASAGAGIHILGIDHAMPFLIEARRRACASGLRISYVRAEAQALPVADGQGAGVVIGGSLNEIGDLDASLREVRRVLQATGRFVSMSLVRAASVLGQMFQTGARTGGIVFPSADETAALFERHGLRVVGRWQYGVVLFLSSVPE